ncbi:hypothetical protein [Lysobacter sp. HA35]
MADSRADLAAHNSGRHMKRLLIRLGMAWVIAAALFTFVSLFSAYGHDRPAATNGMEPIMIVFLLFVAVVGALKWSIPGLMMLLVGGLLPAKPNNEESY